MYIIIALIVLIVASLGIWYNKNKVSDVNLAPNTEGNADPLCYCDASGYLNGRLAEITILTDCPIKTSREDCVDLPCVFVDPDGYGPGRPAKVTTSCGGYAGGRIEPYKEGTESIILD